MRLRQEDDSRRQYNAVNLAMSTLVLTSRPSHSAPTTRVWLRRPISSSPFMIEQPDPRKELHIPIDDHEGAAVVQTT